MLGAREGRPPGVTTDSSSVVPCVRACFLGVGEDPLQRNAARRLVVPQRPGKASTVVFGGNPGFLLYIVRGGWGGVTMRRARTVANNGVVVVVRPSRGKPCLGLVLVSSFALFVEDLGWACGNGGRAFVTLSVDTRYAPG